MSTDNGPSPDHTDGSSNCVSGVLAYVGIGSFVGLAFFFAFYYIKSVLINRHERRPSPLVSLVTAPDVDNTRESRNLGLDLGNISLLPTFPYQPIKRRCRKERHEHRENVSTVECVVCLGELEEGEMVRVLPVCKHYFHVNCIDMWLSTRSSCPMCRAHPEPEKVSWDWCRFHHLGVMIYCTQAHQIEDILVTARHDTFNCSLDHGTARDQNHRMLVTTQHVFCTLDAS